MGGRAEIITPAMEQALTAQVERFAAGSDENRTAAIADTRRLGLGRFADATLRRIISTSKRSREFTNASWELLSASAQTAAR
jgi:hypothetical protein